MNRSDALWLALCTVVWLAGCAVVWRRSPGARSRVPGVKLYGAMLLASLPWIVFIPAGNPIRHIVVSMMGDTWTSMGISIVVIMGAWALGMWLSGASRLTRAAFGSGTGPFSEPHLQDSAR